MPCTVNSSFFVRNQYSWISLFTLTYEQILTSYKSSYIVMQTVAYEITFKKPRKFWYSRNIGSLRKKIRQYFKTKTIFFFIQMSKYVQYSLSDGKPAKPSLYEANDSDTSNLKWQVCLQKN